MWRIAIANELPVGQAQTAMLATASMATPSPSLPPDTALGPVQLTVADLPGATAFYERVVGLREVAREGGLVRLGTADGAPLVELASRPGAPPRARRSSGLFHVALLLPARADLARALCRVVAAGWPLAGASDHLVSEALYLSDPEGNGIEIYRDRPREQWTRRDGELEMATLPLDLDAVVAELAPDERGGGEDAGMPGGTRIGHVHLQVSDLAAAGRFYGETLGFEVTVRSYPGALFLAAGGYHHHVGLNTWASAGGPPAVPGARGLRWLTVALPDRAALGAAAARLDAAGTPLREEDAAILATGPFGIAVRLTARAAAG
jgi:catechol 2,3-dioxygenase